MGRKMIILNGSPRVNGNTSALINEFAKGAEEAGHTVTRFDLQKMNIRGCTGCLAGGKNPESPCTQKDDMDMIYPAFKEADIVVLASPLYFWSFSGQMKTAIDRLFAVMEANNWETPKKDSIMLIAAEADDQENFAPMLDYYETLAKFVGWKNLGHIFAGAVLKVGDIHGKPVLKKAYELGKSIV